MKRLAKNKKGTVVCVFSYWIYYVGPGCIVHLPLTIVGVCVDPVGVGQVCGVDGNVHVKRPAPLGPRVTPGLAPLWLRVMHSFTKLPNCWSVWSAGNIAVHEPSVGVAVMPPTVEGLHVVCGSPS